VRDRLRPVSEAAVESLVALIAELGVMKDAIHIRKRKDEKLLGVHKRGPGNHPDGALVRMQGGNRGNRVVAATGPSAAFPARIRPSQALPSR
jgi:hypothetical protein